MTLKHFIRQIFTQENYIFLLQFTYRITTQDLNTHCLKKQ